MNVLKGSIHGSSRTEPTYDVVNTRKNDADLRGKEYDEIQDTIKLSPRDVSLTNTRKNGQDLQVATVRSKDTSKETVMNIDSNPSYSTVLFHAQQLVNMLQWEFWQQD